VKGKRRQNGNPRDRVGFRLGESERDRYLARKIEHARKDNVNVSDLCKELLYAYFTGDLDTFNQAGEPVATEMIDQRVESAKAKLLGLSFGDLVK
jgi:hypothetical protein